MDPLRHARQARVKLFPTAGPGRIECYYSNIKEVRVYIAVGNSSADNTSIQHSMIRDFMNAIMDHGVPEIEANNDLPDDVVRLFVSISRQIDNGRGIYEVIDASGRAILNNPNARAPSREVPRMQNTEPSSYQTGEQASQHSNQQNSAPSVRAEVFNSTMRRALSTVAGSLNSGQPLNHDMLGGLVADMNTLYQHLPNNQPASQTNLQPNLQASQFNNSPYLQPNMQPNMQPAVQPSIQNNGMVQPGPIAGLSGLFRMVANMTVPRATGTNPNNTVENNMSAARTGPSNTNNHANITDTRTLRNTANPQPFPAEDTKEPTTPNEPDMPSRFRPRGNQREVILADASANTQSPTRDVESKQIASLPHIATPRNEVSHDTIVKLAFHVHRLMLTGKTRPPDFTNLNKSKYRKIKNYIHNITGVWCSQNEIDKFVSILAELNKPGNALTTLDDCPVD